MAAFPPALENGKFSNAVRHPMSLWHPPVQSNITGLYCTLLASTAASIMASCNRENGHGAHVSGTLAHIAFSGHNGTCISGAQAPRCSA